MNYLCTQSLQLNSEVDFYNLKQGPKVLKWYTCKLTTSALILVFLLDKVNLRNIHEVFLSLLDKMYFYVNFF